MIKQDEKDFFYSVFSQVGHKGDFIRNYDIPEGRKAYIVDKWVSKGIWEYGVSLYAGWFEKDALEIFEGFLRNK